MLIGLMLLFTSLAFAQKTDKKEWDFEAIGMFYIYPDDFYLLPVFKADKEKLHLEARYNYEDRETFSLFGGYNFKGGNALEYAITPMVGFTVGLTDGIVPGLEVDLCWKRFEFYNEMEYVFELNDGDNSFYYSWSELTFTPDKNENTFVGLTSQATAIRNEQPGWDTGLTAGFTIKEMITFQGHYFNPFSDKHFGIFSIIYEF